ncbi:MAG: polyphosphate kinase 2 [Bacteroidota bacterium]
MLNSPLGLKYLLAEKNTDVTKALRMARYEHDLRAMQAELIKLQNWCINEGQKIIILFEGRDVAGKTGAIRRITAHINPRNFRIVALPKPSAEEAGQWYFQRYVNRLPKPGEIVFFDRSWYNRAIVEPVNGFCTPEQYNTFMGQVNEFERMILESNTYLIKFYFSITKEKQAERLKEQKTNPLKKWKINPLDEKSQELWDIHTEYKVKMFERTDTPQCPWVVIDANKKTSARLQALRYLLDTVPYQQD